jgi:hypothetical protein
MNDPQVSGEFQDLLDDYLAGLLDEERFARLEELLRHDPSAQDHFARYCRLHTDLHVWLRAGQAGRRALAQIGAGGEGEMPTTPLQGRLSWSRRWTVAGVAGTAAALVVVAVAVATMHGRAERSPPSVAWLVNAQNCQWTGSAIRGDLQPGRVLSLEGGLAEVRFAGGASVVLEGPARLELLSAHSARLLTGRLAANVPEAARGFQILSPQGRVVDLGTEFGMIVGDDGSTEVHVFEGKVEAHGSAGKVDLLERQSAQISGEGVALDASAEAAGVVRLIAPAPTIVPRTRRLDFGSPVPGSLLDRTGQGTGLTHRLPGTGSGLAPRDAHLALDATAARLELTTTRSDINTQVGLAEGEYLGFRLADLGFTGDEDFEISVTVPNIPALHAVGQFGLYAGPRSDRNIRGGLISRREPERYGQFLVNNDGGHDTDLNVVGLLSSGDDLHLTLRRVAGRYSLSVDNRSTGGSSTLAIRHPAFLDGETDIYVGFFAANPLSDAEATLIVKQMEATVWTREATAALESAR